MWELPLEGDSKPVLVLHGHGAWGDGKFSPDGKWIAYQSDESGQDEIYVQGYPSSGGKWQVSGQGGSRPKWSRDGTELFFIPQFNSHTILAARMRTTGTSIQSDTPSELVATRPFPGIDSPCDVTPDGHRFLVLEPAESEGSPPLTVVENWQAELKK